MKRHQSADLLAALAEDLPAISPDLPPPRAGLRSLRVAGGVPPEGALRGAEASKHLWYAAVFPQLTDSPETPPLLQRLARIAHSFTSLVSIELPNALLLEIRGSVRLFGPLERLHEDIDAAWKLSQVIAHSAVTPSPVAALWLARGAKRVLVENTASLAGSLAELPLACTSWDAQWLNTLHAMGVRSVGELLRLPRSGLARRLGPGALLDMDAALAKCAAPRRAFVARERFCERSDFETEVEAVAYLEMACEPLIARCAGFLRRRQAGIQYLELRLRHRVVATTRLRLGLASVTSEERRLHDVVAQKLTRVTLTAAVRGIELRSGTLRPLAASSHDIFASSSGTGSRDTAPQLVERLRARLGEKAVYGVSAVAEHRPEAAWARVQELNLQRVLSGSAQRFKELARSAALDNAASGLVAR